MPANPSRNSGRGRCRIPSNTCSTRRRCRAAGTTSRPTCRKPLPPVLHPGTRQPIGPADLAPLFPMALIVQEVSTEREIDDPRAGARRLPPVAAVAAVSRAPAREGARYAGADLLQVRRRLARRAATSRTPRCRRPATTRRPASNASPTETGAGQWGSSLAFAGALFGLEVDVYMVKVSYQPEAVPARADGDLRRALHRQPVERDQVRPRDPRAEPEQHRQPRHRDLRGGRDGGARRDDTKYALGSVLNHVLLHQTVIGQEAIKQLEMAGDYPDIVIGCTGGGSNFAGIAFPFLGPQLRGGARRCASSPSSRRPARR